MIQCGIDQIYAYSRLFQGKRLGMVSASSAVNRELRPAYVALHEAFPLSCLFSPEHGLHGQFGNWEETLEDPVDPQTGVPVVSLYGNGAVKHVPEHWMERLDAVVYDIQDLGTRFYTYIAVMIRVLEDCAQADKELIILDRPAILSGEITEGCLPDPRYQSIICPYSLPIRYGLTVGELARMVNEERNLNCRLTVIPCEGWQRHQMFPDYGNTWVKPSGAIRDFETALLYPGMCLLEGTDLSEGRGTGRPFRLMGAPFIDGARLSREMNSLSLPGVEFAPAVFTPESSKFKDQRCGGVSLHVTDPISFRSVRTGVSLLYKILELYPGQVNFHPSRWSPEPHIRYLSGCNCLDGERPPLEKLLASWEADCEAFEIQKHKYHIYR